MQRRVTAARAALAVALSGAVAVSCTGSLTGEDTAGGNGAAGAASTTAAPGSHSVLPEPCGAVPDSTLSGLLPDAAPQALDGEPALTYDIGRRVGCTWRSPSDAGTHRLEIDFERVVSYVRGTSDDDQAAQDFRRRAADLGIRLDPREGTAPAGPPPERMRPVPSDAPAGEFAPRALEGIGNAAYVDDRLTTTQSGARRDVTLAFHSGNVIVTVRYAQAVTEPARSPGSAGLQEGATEVARHLAERFSS